MSCDHGVDIFIVVSCDWDFIDVSTIDDFAIVKIFRSAKPMQNMTKVYSASNVFGLNFSIDVISQFM